MRTALVVGITILCGLSVWAGAAEPAAETAAEPEFKALFDEDETPQERSDRYWYLIIGPANVHPRLEESTSEIDRDINGLFGSLLPKWEKPDTFATWRDRFWLWDVHMGVGYSLNDKWSLFSTAGFIMGDAKTDNKYMGGLLGIEAKFHRKVWFVSAGFDYYPWGKPDYADATEGNALMRRLRAGKPYFEAGVGYVNLYGVGQSKIALPLIGDIAKVKHAEYYDLFYLSPRIGYDVPVSERGSVSLMAGYLFFMQHPDEFSSWSFYFLYKHRL